MQVAAACVQDAADCVQATTMCVEDLAAWMQTATGRGDAAPERVVTVSEDACLDAELASIATKWVSISE